MDVLASGYGLLEGPTIDVDGDVFFSDVLGGGVYRLDAMGEITTVVPKRRGVGGVALHADGGLVLSGRDLVHVRHGESRQLFGIDGLPGWNDLCSDSAGRVYAGALRFMVFDVDAETVPGECWRVDSEGEATRLYGGVVHANGIALSPGEDRIYHSDTRAGVVIVHDLVEDAAVGERRFDFPAGAPDGMAIDVDGCPWIASAGGGCVLRLTPEGEVDRRLDVPARTVTSLCFGGAGSRDLYVTTADHTDRPALRGCLLRTGVDAFGALVHPVRI